MKEIENKKMYHSQFHLRFFRVIFNSAKFVVKTDRRDKKMKSFPLSELEFVKCQDNPIAWHEAQQEKSEPKAAILTKDDIEKLYNIDENNKESLWKYNFTLSFAGRQFVLACRTLKELDNWVRVFELLVTMKE